LLHERQKKTLKTDRKNTQLRRGKAELVKIPHYTQWNNPTSFWKCLPSSYWRHLLV